MNQTRFDILFGATDLRPRGVFVSKALADAVLGHLTILVKAPWWSWRRWFA